MLMSLILMHSISCLLECLSEMVQSNYLKSFKSKKFNRQSASSSKYFKSPTPPPSQAPPTTVAPTRAPTTTSPRHARMAAEDIERIYANLIQSDAEKTLNFTRAAAVAAAAAVAEKFDEKKLAADDSLLLYHQEQQQQQQQQHHHHHHLHHVYPTTKSSDPTATATTFYLQPDSEYLTINECKMDEVFDAYLHDHLPHGLKNQEIIAVEQLLDVDRKLEQKLVEMRDKYKRVCVELEAKKATRRLLEVNRDLKKEPTIELGEWGVVRLPHALNRHEKEKYVEYVLENVAHDLQDINNVAMGELLDDDVITTVMEACQSKHPDILFVNPCITQCIQFSSADEICSFLDPIDAKRYDNLFFVINDTSNGSSRGTHWSLLLLSRQAKAFCHYDSLKGMNDKVALELSKKLSNYFETWQIVDVDCEQQTNNTDCGIYVLDNMLRVLLVLKNDVNVDDERITFAKIAKLPPSFTKTRIYMMNTYISSILQKVKRTLRLERQDAE